MYDTFNREITIGDIIVRIHDWGAYDLSIVVSHTPAGFLRTIGLNRNQLTWAKGSTMKSGSNMIILDEPLLRLHLEGDIHRETHEEVETLIQMHLTHQAEIKEQLQEQE